MLESDTNFIDKTKIIISSYILTYLASFIRIFTV